MLDTYRVHGSLRAAEISSMNVGTHTYMDIYLRYTIVVVERNYSEGNCGIIRIVSDYNGSVNG